MTVNTVVLTPTPSARATTTDVARGTSTLPCRGSGVDLGATIDGNGFIPNADPADYVGRHVGDAFVQFIVHPSNPIRKLTNAQLAALYSGKIKNWSELGGNNQPVLLVGEPTSSPYRMIKDALGISYPPDLRVIQNTNQAAIIVAQAPGALSNISTAHDVPERTKFKVVETELELRLQLYLAFRKDAPEQIKKVVDAAASVGTR